MAPRVRDIVHGDGRRVGSGRRRPLRGVCEGEARAARGVDARDPVGACPLRAAAAEGAVLPVRAVGFVACGELLVGCACVGNGGRVCAGDPLGR